MSDQLDYKVLWEGLRRELELEHHRLSFPSPVSYALGQVSESYRIVRIILNCMEQAETLAMTRNVRVPS